MRFPLSHTGLTFLSLALAGTLVTAYAGISSRLTAQVGSVPALCITMPEGYYRPTCPDDTTSLSCQEPLIAGSQLWFPYFMCTIDGHPLCRGGWFSGSCANADICPAVCVPEETVHCNGATAYCPRGSPLPSYCGGGGTEQCMNVGSVTSPWWMPACCVNGQCGQVMQPTISCAPSGGGGGGGGGAGPNSGLVAHYSFDDATGNDDAGGHHLTNNGATPDNGCMTFNGTSNYMTTTDVAGLPSGNAPRSIAYWINTSAYQLMGTPFSLGLTPINGVNDGEPQRFLVGPGSGDDGSGLQYGIFTDAVNTPNNTFITGAEIPPVNSWHHIVFTYDGAQHWQYSLDGTAVRSGTFAFPVNTVTNGLDIGAYRNYPRASPPDHFFKGQMDDVRIYDRVLTASDISQLAQIAPSCAASNGGLTSGLVAHYTFDDGTGRDVTGNGHDAQNNGATPANGCMTFNGTSSYLKTTNVAGLPSGNAPRAIAFWLKYPNARDQGPILTMGLTPANQSFVVGPGWDDNTVAVSYGNGYYGNGLFGDGVNDANNVDLSPTPSFDTWHHIAFVYDGNQHWNYSIDGASVRSGTLPIALNTVTDGVTLGDRPFALPRFLEGSLDDVRIYDRVLTASEIAQLAQIQPSCAAGGAAGGGAAGGGGVGGGGGGTDADLIASATCICAMSGQNTHQCSVRIRNLGPGMPTNLAANVQVSGDMVIADMDVLPFLGPQTMAYITATSNNRTSITWGPGRVGPPLGYLQVTPLTINSTPYTLGTTFLLRPKTVAEGGRNVGDDGSLTFTVTQSTPNDPNGSNNTATIFLSTAASCRSGGGGGGQHPPCAACAQQCSGAPSSQSCSECVGFNCGPGSVCRSGSSSSSSRSSSSSSSPSQCSGVECALGAAVQMCQTQAPPLACHAGPAPTCYVCSGLCGNHALDFGEQCDDGNTVDGDRCDHLCKIEAIFCSSASSSSSP